MSVNIAPLQLQEPGFVDDVAAALRAAGLPAGRLRLEVTETALMRDLDSAVTVLDRLHNLGFRPR